MRPQGIETNYSYSSVKKAVALSFVPFTALNGSIRISMVDPFTAVKGYPASESKILHLASLVQYLLTERRQLLYAHCSKGNVIYEGRMCVWGSQHFKRHHSQERWMVPS